MANPRRSSLQLHSQHTTIPLSDHYLPPSAASAAASLSYIAAFLKRPSAFPFLISLFLLLTWLSLRLQRSPASSSSNYPSSVASQSRAQSGIDADADANIARLAVPSLISSDRRGWILNPISVAADIGLHGGAQFCKSIHVGEIRPGGIRGNHRHSTFNETFLIWGAETKFRAENPRIEGKGFAEVIIGADEVALAACSSGTAHALINVDRVRTTFFLGCQDNIIDYNSSTTDSQVWKDLLT